MFWNIYSGCGKQTPRKGAEITRLSDIDNPGSEKMWWKRLALISFLLPSADDRRVEGGGVGKVEPLSLFSTFLAFGNSHRPNCALCLESDHQEEEWALAKAKSVVPPPKHQVSRDPPRDMSRASKGKFPRSMVCFSWNQGDCSFP